MPDAAERTGSSALGDAGVTREVDAIVVGSGINGMVAAAELDRAGWTVALLERNREVEGFIASGELTLSGYIHDTYSSWHLLFVSGPAYAALGNDLACHGLAYRNTDGATTASVADDGSVSVAYRDPQATAADFTKGQDAEMYLEALQRIGRNAERFGALMGSEVRGPGLVRLLARSLKSNGRRGAEEWLRDAVTSGRSFCARRFAGHEVDHLWVPWLLHARLSPDHASGGMMIPCWRRLYTASACPSSRAAPRTWWRRFGGCPSIHPGPGLGAGSGHLIASTLTARRRRRFIEESPCH